TGAMAIGAVRFTKTPAYGVTPYQLESFSSYGGTLVSGTNRFKPDFVAPDGVSTTINFGSINITSFPQFPSFFGTSCAAPQAAGVATLIVEGRKKYANDSLSPAQMRTILQNSALQIDGSHGRNDSTGYGLIQADSAFKTFAAPKPQITKLILKDTTIR